MWPPKVCVGMALGMCPKDKLYRGYIDLEIQLREFDRCRILYEKFLEFGPENCVTWMRFAELETLLGDTDRARAIYELAVNQPRLDMPELLWKAYIDFEVSLGESKKAKKNYECLLERTLHVKDSTEIRTSISPSSAVELNTPRALANYATEAVDLQDLLYVSQVWMSYAQFELASADESNVELARRVYERANLSLRGANEKEERVLLLEAWREFETQHGDESSLNNVIKKMPRRVKKRQRVQADDGTEEGWEEFFDYIFPEDEATKPNLKLLEMAKAWKKQQQTNDEEKEGEDDDDDSNSSSES
uniref:Pre-mRNA-splicing factor Syf1/CRNKL1-like C-terminal HAT-repeats domain-containing protein n=1 Tax=Timema monikensis TaxID=170555 RepID=A0A7R9HHH7_9NEOP|nr:unnamed protein product [Timema monikensis]